MATMVVKYKTGDVRVFSDVKYFETKGVDRDGVETFEFVWYDLKRHSLRMNNVRELTVLVDGAEVFKRVDAE